MPKLPAIKARTFIRYLESVGFTIIRTKGSHVRLRSNDGRVTTVPMHGNMDIPKGLLRKIIREDLEMTLDTFLKSYDEYRGEH